MGYIYLITNKINRKQYVGQTLEEDIHTRWDRHKKKCPRSLGRYILAAYNKYGIENFKFQIICICFNEDCNKYEGEYIQKFNTISPNGYNLMSGGNNGKHHPETKRLISEKLKGRVLTTHTPEMRKKHSERMKGENNPNYKKPMSEEQKQKISKMCKKNHKKGIYKNKSKVMTEKCLKALEIGRENKKKKLENMMIIAIF